jgi:hypothetical protein
MFVEANVPQAEPLAALAKSLRPDEVQLNTPLRPSPIPPLPPAAMREVARVFAGLHAVQVYAVHRPTVAPLDPHATRLRRPEWAARSRGSVTAVRAGGQG